MRLEANRRTGVLLAVLLAAVVVVLLDGAARRQTAPGPAPSAGEPGARTPALGSELDKAPLSYLSDYWFQLASRTRSRLLRVGASGTPAVVIADRIAVSTCEASQRLGTAAPERPETSGSRLLASSIVTGLAIFELEASASSTPFELAEPSSLHPGMLIAGVSLDAEGRLQVMPGHVISSSSASPSSREGIGYASLEVSIPLVSARLAAIVDLDGHLVGVAFMSSGTLIQLSARALANEVDRMRRHPICMSVEVEELDPAVRKLLGIAGGVVVQRVERASFPEGAPIRMGDVLLEWAGRPVSTASEFESVYASQQPGAPVPFVVRRGASRLVGRLSMPGSDCRAAEEESLALPSMGVELAPAPRNVEGNRGWIVERVAPASPASSAGLENGDLVLGVNGGSADRSEVLRALRDAERRKSRTLVAIRRDGRARLLVLGNGGT